MARAIFLGSMRETAKLSREAFDIRWVTTDIRISVFGTPHGMPTVMADYDRVKLGGERSQDVHLQLLQAHLEDM